MFTNVSAAEPLRITTVRGHLCVTVPWSRAEGLQTRLRKQGIGSTLQLEPMTRAACLEVWPGVDEDRVRAALESVSR
jgi:hypothetical protein